MLSLFPDQYDARRSLCVFALGCLAFGVPFTTLHAQEIVEPVAPTHVIVHGAESHFDLADLGPDFAEPWLEDLLPSHLAPDEAPALTQRLTMASTEDDWVRQTRTTYERTDDGQLREERVEQWDSTAWTNAARTTYTYDDDTLVRQRTEVWVEDQWERDQQFTYAHDAEGQIREVVHQARRDGQWMKTARLTFNPADSSRQFVRETWSDDAWEPITRVTFTVGEEGRHVIQHNETWTGEEWDDSVRFTFMYDGAGYPLEKIVEVWTGAQWAEGPLQLYDYEVDGHRVVQRAETWVGSNRIRTEQTELTYTTPLHAWLSSEAPRSD